MRRLDGTGSRHACRDRRMSSGILADISENLMTGPHHGKRDADQSRCSFAAVGWDRFPPCLSWREDVIGHFGRRIRKSSGTEGTGPGVPDKP